MTVIAEYKDLRVHECFNGYEVEHIPTGECRGIGDGVDQYYLGRANYDGDVAVSPGTELWNRLCAKDLRATYDDWLQAYFPDVTIVTEEQE